MKTKICSNPKCQKELPLSEFHISKKGKFGRNARCKICVKEYQKSKKSEFSLKDKIKYQKNKEKIKQRSKEYYALNKNKEEFKQKRQNYQKKNRLKHLDNLKQKYQETPDIFKERSKQYRLSHKEVINNYFNKKRVNDINFKLAGNLRSRIWKALKRNSKSERTSELLGCSIDELKIHLEKQFKSDMTWDNYGDWHIDHITPCASFNLSKPEEQRKCFHYKNLQPLWAIDNLKKSDKY